MLTLRLPLIAQVEITDKCNYSCPHCYVYDFSEQMRESSDLDDQRVLELAGILSQNRLYSVVITGGEPLIRKRLVFKLISLFLSYDVKVFLNTNLMLLDNDTLFTLRQSGLESILVSCPATDPEIYRHLTGRGDYLNFEKKLIALQNSGIKFSINMVVTPVNLSMLMPTAQKLHALGVKKFGATPTGLNRWLPRLDMLLTPHDVGGVVLALLRVKNELGMDIDIFEALPKWSCPISLDTLFLLSQE